MVAPNVLGNMGKGRERGDQIRRKWSHHRGGDWEASSPGC